MHMHPAKRRATESKLGFERLGRVLFFVAKGKLAFRAGRKGNPRASHFPVVERSRSCEWMPVLIKALIPAVTRITDFAERERNCLTLFAHRCLLRSTIRKYEPRAPHRRSALATRAPTPHQT